MSIKSVKKEDWEHFWIKVDLAESRIKDAFYLIDQTKLEYLLPLLPKECKKPLKSLEVGAGSGRLSRFLAKRGYRTTCLDFSPQALKLAKKYYDAANLKGEFIEGEAENMPFNDGEFDVVFSTGLLEHFEDPMPIIFEMVRVLRIGGLFYSDIVPKKFSLLRSLNFIGPLLGRARDPLFEMPFTNRDIRGFLGEAKLKDVNVFPAGIFPPSIPLLRRLYSIRYLESVILQRLTPLLKRLDKTLVADYLGFYYFAYGYK